MNDKENAAQPEAASGGNSIEEIMSKVYDEKVQAESRTLEKEASPASEDGSFSKEIPESTAEKTENVDNKVENSAEVKQAAPVNDPFKEIDEAFAPIKDSLKREGISQSQYIKQVIAAENLLERDPMNGLAHLAGIYNIDLVKFSQAVLKKAGLDVQSQQGQNAQQKPNDDQYIDPSVQPLYKKLSDLEARQNMMLKEKQQAEHNRIISEINDFSSKQKYWGKVEDEIIPLVAAYKSKFPQKNNQEILQKAYETAIWSNPEVKAILLNEERVKQLETANAKAVSAKKAGSSVTGSPSGKVSTKPLSGLSTEEIMTKLWDQQETGRIQ